MDGIVFIARLGSTRLPEKHLIQAGGRPFIEWLVQRFAQRFSEEIAKGSIKLILATSDEPINKRFEDVLKSSSIETFYGSVNNIPLRLLQCGKAFTLENIISIDGDDILCSTEAAKKVIGELKSNSSILWAKTSGLPLGMNVAGYKISALTQKEAEIGEGKLETGWGRVFDSATCATINLGEYESRTDLRFTLDYEEDAKFFKSTIESLNHKLTATDKEIIDHVISHKLNEINSEINAKYWQNFNNQIINENS
jgi:spore coat polysaccharide biosynthesis protein SpsF (cytidylyltransferase family)